MVLRRKRTTVLIGLLCVVVNLNSVVFGYRNMDESTPAVAPQPYFTEPALSPDRKEIAFVSGGDIWTVPATGGAASLLVSNSANEARPLYSPDGNQLAFISTRTGNGDIYLLTLSTGELKRLTFDDGADQLDGWSRDGRWIYFSSTSRDIGGLNDIFRVSAAGGTPCNLARIVTQTSFLCTVSRWQYRGLQCSRDRFGSMVAQRPQSHRRVGDLAAPVFRQRQWNL